MPSNVGMKPIKPAAHTIVDYLFCTVTALAPTMLGFGGVPATLCYGVAVGYLVFSLLTNTPTAPFRLIPFRVHGMVEIAAGFLLLFVPWLFGFSENVPARAFFAGAGLVTFGVYFLTEWREEPVRQESRLA